MASLHVIIPHTHLVEESGRIDARMLESAYLVAFGLILHDFPEGFAMANSYVASPSSGVLVALAIALHNIPEEFAMAAPAVALRWASRSVRPRRGRERRGLPPARDGDTSRPPVIRYQTGGRFTGPTGPHAAPECHVAPALPARLKRSRRGTGRAVRGEGSCGVLPRALRAVASGVSAASHSRTSDRSGRGPS